MKKYLGYIITSVISIIVASGVTVLAYNYNAKDIAYTPSDSSWNVSNVTDAIDELKENELSLTEIYTNKLEYNARPSEAKIELELPKGKFVCNYAMTHATANADVNFGSANNNWRGVSIKNCSKINILDGKNTLVAASTKPSGFNMYYLTSLVTQYFTCDMNDTDTIVLSQTYGENTLVPMVQDITCLKIK